VRHLSFWATAVGVIDLGMGTASVWTVVSTLVFISLRSCDAVAPFKYRDAPAGLSSTW
jgi:hypothetical protein